MTAEPDEVCEVIITAPHEAWLLAFTRKLVEARLAACGHHMPIRSIYTWDGAIQDERETRVALHTRASCVPAITALTNQQHPYDVPCVIALPITQADPAYRAWILDSTRTKASQPVQTYDHGTFLIVLDCADLNRSADFWCPALGYDRPFPQSGPYLQLVAEARGGVELLLQQVPEPKSGKNRLHLDLRTPDLEVEVARLVSLGAAIVTDTPLTEHDWTWHVLADPDGNEFCVLQPPSDFAWPPQRTASS